MPHRYPHTPSSLCVDPGGGLVHSPTRPVWGNAPYPHLVSRETCCLARYQDMWAQPTHKGVSLDWEIIVEASYLASQI